MNSRFERRVDTKGAEKSMANCDKTKSDVILSSKTLIQI